MVMEGYAGTDGKWLSYIDPVKGRDIDYLNNKKRDNLDSSLTTLTKDNVALMMA